MTTRRRPRPRRFDPVIYPYHDEHGREVFQHVRWRLDPPEPRAKMFTYRWRHAPDHVWVNTKPEGADRLLYRLPELLAVLPTVDAVWWPEGEKCAEAIRARGAVATSHHGGAGKVSEDQAAWLTGYRGIVNLVADRDLPGAACAVRRYDLLRAVGIPARRLRILVAADRITPDTKHPGTDAADHLGYWFLGLDDFENVPIDTARKYAKKTAKQHYADAGYMELPPGWPWNSRTQA